MKHKAVFVGESGVGKTSILNSLANVNNPTDVLSTIAFQSITLKKEMGNGEQALLIWDTAGQEQFRSLVDNYFRDSCIVFVVFSCTDMQSLSNVKFWTNKAWETSNLSSIVIIENKIDLLETQNCISDEIVKSELKGIKYNHFVKVSAQSSEGIDDLRDVAFSLLDPNSPNINPINPIPNNKNQCCYLILFLR